MSLEKSYLYNRVIENNAMILQTQKENTIEISDRIITIKNTNNNIFILNNIGSNWISDTTAMIFDGDNLIFYGIQPITFTNFSNLTILSYENGKLYTQINNQNVTIDTSKTLTIDFTNGLKINNLTCDISLLNLTINSNSIDFESSDEVIFNINKLFNITTTEDLIGLKKDNKLYIYGQDIQCSFKSINTPIEIYTLNNQFFFQLNDIVFPINNQDYFSDVSSPNQSFQFLNNSYKILDFYTNNITKNIISKNTSLLSLLRNNSFVNLLSSFFLNTPSIFTFDNSSSFSSITQNNNDIIIDSITFKNFESSTETYSLKKNLENIYFNNYLIAPNSIIYSLEKSNAFLNISKPIYNVFLLISSTGNKKLLFMNSGLTSSSTASSTQEINLQTSQAYNFSKDSSSYTIDSISFNIPTDSSTTLVIQDSQSQDSSSQESSSQGSSNQGSFSNSFLSLIFRTSGSTSGSTLGLNLIESSSDKIVFHNSFCPLGISIYNTGSLTTYTLEDNQLSFNGIILDLDKSFKYYFGNNPIGSNVTDNSSNLLDTIFGIKNGNLYIYRKKNQNYGEILEILKYEDNSTDYANVILGDNTLQNNGNIWNLDQIYLYHIDSINFTLPNNISIDFSINLINDIIDNSTDPIHFYYNSSNFMDIQIQSTNTLSITSNAIVYNSQTILSSLENNIYIRDTPGTIDKITFSNSGFTIIIKDKKEVQIITSKFPKGITIKNYDLESSIKVFDNYIACGSVNLTDDGIDYFSSNGLKIFTSNVPLIGKISGNDYILKIISTGETKTFKNMALLGLEESSLYSSGKIYASTLGFFDSYGQITTDYWLVANFFDNYTNIPLKLQKENNNCRLLSSNKSMVFYDFFDSSNNLNSKYYFGRISLGNNSLSDFGGICTWGNDHQALTRMDLLNSSNISPEQLFNYDSYYIPANNKTTAIITQSIDIFIFNNLISFNTTNKQKLYIDGDIFSSSRTFKKLSNLILVDSIQLQNLNINYLISTNGSLFNNSLSKTFIYHYYQEKITQLYNLDLYSMGSGVVQKIIFFNFLQLNSNNQFQLSPYYGSKITLSDRITFKAMDFFHRNSNASSAMEYVGFIIPPNTDSAFINNQNSNLYIYNFCSGSCNSSTYCYINFLDTLGKSSYGGTYGNMVITKTNLDFIFKTRNYLSSMKIDSSNNLFGNILTSNSTKLTDWTSFFTIPTSQSQYILINKVITSSFDQIIAYLKNT